MKHIYISGAISGRDKKEYQKHFESAEDYLERWGYSPINPASDEFAEAHFFEHKDYKAIMRVDINVLAGCDSIYMLKGWEHSMGARAEHAFAAACGMTILYE